jgi:hypothetical protein
MEAKERAAVNKNKRMTIIAAAAIIAITALGVELLCFIFFNIYKDRFTFYDIKRYTVTADEAERLKKVYDFKLGWKKIYQTPFGERPRSKDYGKPLLAAFGDSFTHCDEVKDDQTWEEFLSNILHADVFNFGGGGYGTDQAYLRFQAEYSKAKTPLVALGLITENINRIVNVYRPFYFERTGDLLSKPRFILKDGERVLLDNPLKNAAETIKLTDQQFVRSMGENDWWFNRDNLPVFGFPYSNILFHKRFWLEAFYRKSGREIDDIDPRPWEDLWKYAPARDLMFSILDSFILEARKLGAKPLIVLMPRRFEVIQKVRGHSPDDAAILMEFCKTRGYPCFNGVEALASQAASENDVNGYFRGHLSPQGNMLVAKALYGFLLENKFVIQSP